MLNESRLNSTLSKVRGLSEADPPKSVRMNSSLRNTVNRDLDRELKGKYMPSVGAGINKISQVLNRHGFEELDAFSNLGKKGHSTFRIAKRTSDPFSPEEVVNTMLVVSYGPTGDRGNFEVLAYLS